VRSTVGRINDVIHAAAISQVLTQVLEPGEEVTVRPSLAAGNDPSRPFDVETNLRVAEFKIAEWKGKDAMRKRGVFADLVNLAADDSDRKAQLYVVADAPIHFLRSSTSSASWGLNRSGPNTRERYAERFDPEWKLSISEFTAGPAAHVELIDLRTFLPALGG
jgi:hypothetical protein